MAEAPNNVTLTDDEVTGTKLAPSPKTVNSANK
jgi:hypothetical protein